MVLKFNLVKKTFDLKNCSNQFFFLATIDKYRDHANEEQGQNKKKHTIGFYMCVLIYVMSC